MKAHLLAEVSEMPHCWNPDPQKFISPSSTPQNHTVRLMFLIYDHDGHETQIKTIIIIIIIIIIITRQQMREKIECIRMSDDENVCMFDKPSD